VVVTRRAVAVAACLTVLCAPLSGPALARSKHHRKRVGACNAHRKHATRKTSQVIVYGKRKGFDMYDGALTTYYTCARPRGKSIVIGQSSTSDGEYPANEVMSDLRVAGSYVADLYTTGYADAAACSKYEGSDDPTCMNQIRYSINGANAKSRRGFEIDLPVGPTAIALSSAGAIAWLTPTSSSSGVTLQAMVLRRGSPGHLSGTVRTLDTGAIGSLRFNGSTLSWTNAGTPKSQPLS
jgi:hypothetical protein